MPTGLVHCKGQEAGTLISRHCKRESRERSRHWAAGIQMDGGTKEGRRPSNRRILKPTCLVSM